MNMLVKRILPISLAIAMMTAACVPASAQQDNVSAAAVSTTDISTVKMQQSAVLTFTNSSITETQAGRGYSIDGTALTITANGTYRLKGSCSNGSIVVSKELTDVTLVLDSLSLSSSDTAPIVIKKSSSVNIHLEGRSTLTDNEDAGSESTSDTFEGAAIKLKSGSKVTFCGDGDLIIAANAKNGIKGASCAQLVFNQTGTLTVSGNGKYYAGTKTGAAVQNGISCDGSIIFNQGSYVIKAAGDGIKSAPDATDTAEGTTIDTESAGTVTINAGTFDIDTDGDGISADTALTINGGTFDIQTYKGSSTWNNTLAASNSCKGLKASGDRAEEANIEPNITVSGGTFILNTADDALHSDGNAVITGGTFTISTGDDGMHADKTLTLGTQNGLERDPDITINKSYEGFEGENVYIYSGRFYVVASDDGVNAAGGSSNGSQQGGGGGHDFRPGGRPGGQTGGGQQSSAGNYNISIYGGDLYVNCDGDGIDSNGGIYLYGGRQAVFSMKAGGDNSAIDADTTVLIQGATVFTAGTKGVDGTAKSSWFGSGQKYYTSTTSTNAGSVINTTAGSGNVIFSYTLPKNVNYVMASWPTSVSSSTPAFYSVNSTTSCKGGSHSHSWNNGTVKTAATSTSKGVITYTCTTCGETEEQSIPMTAAIAECDHSVEVSDIEETFTVSFDLSEGVSVDVYYTQDTGTADEKSVTSAVARDSDTGSPDTTGDGQINFTVVVADGYSFAGLTADDVSGDFKNLKDISTDTLPYTYRITKIKSDIKVSVSAQPLEQDTPDIVRLAGADRYKTAAAISQQSYETSDTVILAYGLNYADALAGVPLAQKYSAPILLTNTDKLPSATLDEIKRLKAENVIILGGEGVISKEVVTELENNDLKVERIAGETRFSTAAAIAKQLNPEPTDVFFVYGLNYADALSVSTAAAIKNAPIIYLTTSGELNPDTAAYLAALKAKNCVSNAYVIGGEGVISDDMMNKAKNALGLDTITRVAGKNRYATCVEVKNKFKDVITGSAVYVAKGLDFPDALAGGVFAAQQKAPLFLADNALTDEQKTYLKTKKADTVYVFGGTGAVPDKLVTEITTASK